MYWWKTDNVSVLTGVPLYSWTTYKIADKILNKLIYRCKFLVGTRKDMITELNTLVLLNTRTRNKISASELYSKINISLVICNPFT